jgi:multidrug/hemolysin transport system ATP-binding protein
MERQLIDSRLPYDIKSNHIHITIPDTMSSLEILNRAKENLKSFEVIQGTMDDVFLNITGKSL